MEYSISQNEPLLDMKGVIGLKYKLIRLIGEGSFGKVYMGQHKRSGELVAIKCEDKESKSKLLKNETKIYRELNGGKGIANVRWYGVDDKKTYAVLDLLGNSLDDFKIKYRKFSLKSTLLVGIQLLYRMEYIHSKGYLHRDIKPENFMFGNTGKSERTLYVIDFGLSKPYLTSGNHIDMRINRKMIGTPRYASLNVHNGCEPSRRDDLISIGYMLIYLFKGSLPWQGQKGNTKSEKYRKIADIKKTISFEQLCTKMPKELICYIEYCYDLEFNESPNYEMLRRLFKRALQNNNLENDNKFEWTT